MAGKDQTNSKKNPPKPRKRATKKPPRIRKKDIFRQQIVRYIGNPENKFPTRSAMAKEICETSLGNFYKHFTIDEMLDMENEGFELRKRSSLRHITQVYNAMEEAAIGYEHDAVHISNYQGDITETDITKKYPPNPAAASVLLDRLQGKVKNISEVTGADGEALFPQGFLPLSSLDLTECTDEELALLEKIGMRLSSKNKQDS